MFASRASLEQAARSASARSRRRTSRTGSSSRRWRRSATPLSTKRKKRVPRLVGVGRLVELERADADALLARVDVVVAVQQRHASGRAARARRGRASTTAAGRRRSGRRSPPSRSVTVASVELAAARRAAAGSTRPAAVAGEALGFDAHRHAARSRPMSSVEKCTPRERRAALAPQLDRAPDADRGQPRAPVPAEAELRLAHPPRSGLRAPGAQGRAPRCAASGGSKRIASVFVAPHAAAVTSNDGRAEHIRVPAELARRSGRRSRTCRARGRRAAARSPGAGPGASKRGAVPPLALLHPRAGGLVAVVERVSIRPASMSAVWTSPGTSTGTQRAGRVGRALAGREVAHLRRRDERPHPCERPRCRRCHYFTPPAVSPRTIHFCAARKAITTGALTTIAAAMSWFQ